MSATIIVDGEEFAITKCNGSDRCRVALHVHGCYSDLECCDEAAEHEVQA